MKLSHLLLSITVLVVLAFAQTNASNVTKTVGISGGYDYPTLRVALDDINNNAIADSVTLMLMDTLYTDYELKLNPAIPNFPSYFAMAQGGSKKPEINISQIPGFTNDSIAFKAEGVRDVTIYNCIWLPNPAETWKSAVRVDDCEPNGTVYIQSGGVTGSSTERGYDVHADNSVNATVFGCLIINVATTAINIEYSACAGPKLSTGGTTTIEGNTIYGSNSAQTTGISVSGGSNITAQDNNVLYCDMGTVITNTEEGGTITILGGTDSVYTSSVSIPQARNLASIEIASSPTLKNGKKTRRSMFSMQKFAKNGGGLLRSARKDGIMKDPSANAIDISLVNDDDVTTDVNIDETCTYWAGGDGIYLDGATNATMSDNVIDLDGTGSAFNLRGKGIVKNVGGGLNPTLSFTGNQLSNFGNGYSFHYDNEEDTDTSSGYSDIEISQGAAIIGILAVIAIPNFVAMKVTRPDKPVAIPGLKLEGNDVSIAEGIISEGVFLDFPDSNFYIGNVEINDNEISNVSFSNNRNCMSPFWMVHQEATFSLSGNDFTESEMGICVGDYFSVKMDSNFFTSGECTDCAPGIPKNNKAINRYELQVRGSNRVRKTGTTEADVMNVSISGNNYCGVEAVTTVEDGNLTFQNNTVTGGSIVAGKAGNQYELQFRRSGRLNKTAASDDTLTGNVKNNTFCGVDILISSEDVDMNIENNNATGGTSVAKAVNKYELQFRRSSRFNKSESDSMFYASVKNNTFSDGDFIVNDSDVVLTMENNTIDGGSSALSKASSSTQIRFNTGRPKTGKALGKSSHPDIAITGNTFSNTDNDWEIHAFNSLIENNTINGSSALSKASSSTQIRFNTGRPATRKTAEDSLPSFAVFNDNTIFSSDVTINDTDVVLTMENNTFDGGSSAFNKAGNKYEINTRRGARINKSSSSATTENPLFTYNDNTVNAFYDVVMNIDESATMTGNTFDGTNASGPTKAGNKYEINTRRGQRLNKTTSTLDNWVTYSGNSVISYDVIMHLDDSSDVASSVTMDGNTFDGGVDAPTNKAGRKYELQVRASSRAQKNSSAVDEEYLYYTKNTHTNFDLGGLIGLEDVCATLDSNTFTGGVLKNSKAAKKFELQPRRSDRVGKTTSTEMCLSLSNNSFTNLAEGGLLARISNLADDTMNVEFIGNDFSDNDGNGLEVVMDSGSVCANIVRNDFSNNTGNGIHGLSIEGGSGKTAFDRCMRSLERRGGNKSLNETNNFTNNGGNGYYVSGNIRVEGLNYQNFSGNTGYNLYNGTPNDIDATNNWWGTTNATTIGDKIFDKTDSSDFGTVTFIPFLGDSVTSSTGTISGIVYSDANNDSTRGQTESGLEGVDIILSSGGVAIDTVTSGEDGAYSFGEVSLATYSVRGRSIPENSIEFTENANGTTVDFSTTYTETVNFGVFVDQTKFRTIKASTQLSLKPIKLKKPKLGAFPLPNIANIRDTITKANAGIVVGRAQTKDSAKFYGWLAWGKGADFGKFYSSIQTGRSYPVDSLRVPTKKTKVIVKALKGDAKKYNNPLAQELGVFKMNLAGSVRGVFPFGLSNLEINMPGTSYHGTLLGALATDADSAMTYWKRYPLLRDTTVAEQLRLLVKSINDAFADSINDSTQDVKRISPLQLNGITKVSEVPFLKRSSKNNAQWNFSGTETNTVPNEFALAQNYPNPFNPTTNVSFVIRHSSLVTLKVYDVLGREVATLLNNETLEEGSYDVTFDANGLTSGVYFYRIQAGTFSEVKKMVLMK